MKLLATLLIFSVATCRVVGKSYVNFPDGARKIVKGLQEVVEELKEEDKVTKNAAKELLSFLEVARKKMKRAIRELNGAKEYVNENKDEIDGDVEGVLKIWIREALAWQADGDFKDSNIELPKGAIGVTEGMLAVVQGLEESDISDDAKAEFIGFLEAALDAMADADDALKLARLNVLENNEKGNYVGNYAGTAVAWILQDRAWQNYGEYIFSN